MYNYAHTQKEKESIAMKDITWKKWIALTLSAALTLSTLTACGGEKDQPEETQTVQANYADMTISSSRPR